MKNIFGEEIKEEVEEVVEKTKSLSPFDWINAITSGKDLLSKDPQLKSFNPYMVIRGLSQHEHLVSVVNVLNRNPKWPKLAQYLYLKSVIPKGRLPRVAWAKDNTSKEILAITSVYKCNKDRAAEYLDFLSPDVVKKIIKKYNRLTKGK